MDALGWFRVAHTRSVVDCLDRLQVLPNLFVAFYYFLLFLNRMSFIIWLILLPFFWNESMLPWIPCWSFSLLKSIVMRSGILLSSFIIIPWLGERTSSTRIRSSSLVLRTLSWCPARMLSVISFHQIVISWIYSLDSLGSLSIVLVEIMLVSLFQ